jgi:hypothetical protein
MNNHPERRMKPRVECDYPVIIEGYDVDGNPYDESGNLSNLSASGLFLKAKRYINDGSKISVTVLLTSNLVDKNTPRIATNGIVVRAEPQADGTCGIAVMFNSYRFL